MSTQARDTRPEAERVQIELLRKATVERRLELGLSLCQQVSEIAYAGIKRANPSASQKEIELLFVEANYGRSIANRVKTYLWSKAGE